MFYNNKNQPFTIENRFTLTVEGETVHYCRVKFYNTKKVQVILAKQFDTGEFEDESLIVQEDVIESTVETELEEDIEVVDTPVETEVQPPIDNPIVVQDDIASIGEPVVQMIIVTKPNGKETKINMNELETFCNNNKLELEAVQSVLEGKQKTHRKFRFKLA